MKIGDLVKVVATREAQAQYRNAVGLVVEVERGPRRATPIVVVRIMNKSLRRPERSFLSNQSSPTHMEIRQSPLMWISEKKVY